MSTDREALLDSIAEYAARLAKADQLADADTLSKAADAGALYDEGSWIEEWQRITPAKKDATGRIDPGSRNRFAHWLVWAEEQRGKSAPPPRVTTRLMKAHDITRWTSGPTAPTSEFVVRPLSWLEKARYEDRIPEVWARAVELADGQPVTQAHVRKAIAEFRAKLTPAQNRAAIASQRARTHRLKAQSAVEQLWSDRDVAEAEAFKQWFLTFLQDNARAAA